MAAETTKCKEAEKTGLVEASAAERKVNSVLRHVFLNNAVRDLTIQAEVQVFQMLFEGLEPVEKASAVARLMGKTQSLVGLGEFIWNPVVGKLSDAIGRKPFTLLGCSWCVFGSLLVARSPTSRIIGIPLVAINRLINNTCLTISGSVTSGVAISDICSGKDLAVALGRMGAMFGLGSVFGPYIGATLLSKSKSVRLCYVARALLAAFQILHNLFTLQETLSDERRRPVALRGLNPFGFLNLLRSEMPLLRLVMSQTLISCSEVKNVTDVKTLWMKQNLQYTVEQINREQVAYASMMFFSGNYLAPMVIKRFGQRLFTDFALWTTASAFFMWGSFPNVVGVVLGSGLMFPGVNATSSMAIKAAATDHAVAQGFGKGEFGSYIANLRALTVVIAPAIYGYVYSHFMLKFKGRGGLVWLLVALLTAVCPALLHRSISDAKFAPKKHELG